MLPTMFKLKTLTVECFIIILNMFKVLNVCLKYLKFVTSPDRISNDKKCN